MSNLASKACRRILAVVLSIAMIMPNMSLTAYATESSAAQDEITVQDNDGDVKAEDGTTEDGSTSSGGDTSEDGNTPSEGGDSSDGDDSGSTEGTGGGSGRDYTAILDVSELGGDSEISKNLGTVEENKGTDGYFTVFYKNGKEGSSPSKIQKSSQKFSEDYTGTHRINFGGSARVAVTEEEETDPEKATSNAIQFKTETAATVTVWWRGGGSGTRYVRILNDKNEEVVASKEQSASGSDYFVSEMKLFTGGTYYLGPAGGSNHFYKVQVHEKEDEERAAWSDVAAPTLEAEAGESSITVTVTANVGIDGGDKIEVIMSDAAGEEVESQTSTVQEQKDNKYTFEFKPTASGTYRFVAVLSRADGEELLEKKSEPKDVEFGKSLDAPTNLVVADTSTDEAVSIKVTWNAVTEADGYIVTVKDAEAAEDAEPVLVKDDIAAGTDTTVSVDIVDEKLERGKTYKVSVAAKKGEEIGAAVEKAVTVGEEASKGGTFTLDVADLTAGEKAKGTIEAGVGTNGYFDIIYKASGTSNVQTNEHEFSDGYVGTQRINFGGNVSVATKDTENTTNAIKFTTVNSTVKVTVWWQGGGSGTRYLRILNGANEEVVRTTEEASSGSEYFISEMTLNAEGTYYLGPTGGSSHIYKVKIVDGEAEAPPVTNNKYALDVADLTAGEKAKGTIEAGVGTNGYFDIIYKASGTSNVQTNEYEFSDGYVGTQRINFGGNVSVATKDTENTTNAIKFTVADSTATVTVWWQGGGSGTRYLRILNDANEEVTRTTEEASSGSEYFISKMTLNAGGTYYLGPTGGSSHIYKVEVIDGEDSGSGPVTPGRGDWETDVAAPEITEVVDNGDGTIKITVKGVINREGVGADSVAVEVYNADHLTLENPQPLNKDKDGKILTSTAKATTADANGNHLTTLTYTPSGSGEYALRAILSRADETDEAGNVTASYEDKISAYSMITFKLPLQTPEISTLMNLDAVDDKGRVTASWNDITEADYYIVYAKDANGNVIAQSANTEGTSAEVAGLTIGDTVYVTVIAYRENTSGDPDKSEESASKEIKITGVEPNAYIMDAGDYDLGVMSAGTKLGTQDYYTLMLDSTLSGKAEVKSASTGKFIEINKYGSTGLTFTVYGTADASFTVASTGNSNLSAFGLVNSNGVMVQGAISGNANDTSIESPVYEADTENKGTAYLAYGTTTSTIDYKDLPAGTYTFLSPFAGQNRGGRVHKAVVYDSGDMPDRGEWSGDDDKIGTPEISKITYVKGDPTITVTASGYIGYYGADSLKVDMLASNGEVVDTIIQAADSKTKTATDAEGNPITDAEGNLVIVSDGDVDLTYVFTPKASDNYSFRASLVRNGQEDIVMKDNDTDWTVDNFVLPLATPSVSSTTNVEYSADKENSGSLEVYFTEVAEADYYVIAAFSDTELLAAEYFDIDAYNNEDAKETEDGKKSKFKLGSAKDENKEYKVILENLPKGSCYVSVQAFRNANSELKLEATTTTITRVTTTAETGEVSVSIDKSVKDTLTLGVVAELKKLEGNANLSDEELEALIANLSDEELKEYKEAALKSLKIAISPQNGDFGGFAVAVARSMAFSPDASKYVNGKNDTRWSHTVYGSNTTRSTYSRAAGLNAFDGEYPSGASATVPSNGYYEEVYKADDTKPEGKDQGDLKSVTLWSENGRGKVVPASIDGLSYYYTTIDPSANNFTLSALIHVKSWQYSNGQDGFGMMVSDTVGVDGDSGDTWTNAYQLLASKIQYSWYRAADGNPGYVTTAPGNGTTVMRYQMNIGVGWNAKEGATAADVAKIKAGTATAPANFATSSGTLETAAGNNDKYTGTYNIIGNGYNQSAIPESADSNLLTDLRFQIQKYDNAYVLRYLAVNATAADAKDENKNYITIGGSDYEVLGEQVFSDDNNNKLTQIDKNNIYVGFFAARNARIGVGDINLNLTEAGNGDYPIPTTYVDPSVTISSMEASNNKNYDLMLSANFDGTLTVYKEEADGTRAAVTTGKAITAGTKYTFTAPLNEGTTKFIYYAKPNENYVPGENQEMSRFDMLTNEQLPFAVTYHAFAGDTIYVAPNGALIGTQYTVTEDGVEKTYYAGNSAAYPTNVYDAVNYAATGQTIVLAGGMYNLSTDAYSSDGVAANLLIGKNHDGTSKSYITMKAADDAVDNGTTNNRPILNFGQNTQKNDTAFTIAGNYWYLEGFDVMGSRDGQKGILLAGSHNVLSDMRTYLNGNTGVQIARYGSDSRPDWPSYNTLINCSSFMNYDAGYEDADGYAAKLTCGDGNKFIGCISAYNADDGWDLFAKIESGSIGVVTIENCLAFKNGYLFGEEDYYGSGSDLIYRYTDLSKYTKNTHLVNAGNGNGFKMGGDSMSGYHVLRNSIAFGNKSKGIDSNSCPDIQVYNCISFNNEANNVALYTGGAVNTDYNVEKLISVKDSSCSGYATTENIELRGTQNRNKVYGSENYYWTGARSENSNGDVFDTSRFGHMSMNTAIFGGANAISRDADGSINLHGFLVVNGESNVGNTSKDDALDMGADIYVFAAEYCKSGMTLKKDIKLDSSGANEAAKKLAADYEWKLEKDINGNEVDIDLAPYAGTSVDFTVTDKATKTKEKTVTVSFIQLDGAELQIVSGDDNNDGVLNAIETWTVEAVPVISPAVEPDVTTITGFEATIVENSKDLLKLGNYAAGEVNKNLNVKGARFTVDDNGSNGDAKMTATVSLTAGGKTVKQTAVLTFAVSKGDGIKFDTIDPEPTPDSDKVRWTSDHDYIQVAMGTMTGQTFTMKNLHFVDGVNEDGTDKIADFGKGVKISVNDTSVIKLTSTANSTNGVDATFTVVNKSGDGGTATVTVTSKNDKSLVRNYIVTVSGSEFAWNAGTITIDKAKTAGVQLTALAPFDQSMDNVRNGIQVDAVYKGAKVSNTPASGLDSYFVASQAAGSVYELNTTKDAVTGLPKGTYTVVYKTKVTTTNEDGTTKESDINFTPITIKVIETRPTVTFKQTKKVNLFYKNGTKGSTGTLTASSKQGAVTIVDVKNAVNSNADQYFRFANNGSGYDIVSINKTPVSLTRPGGPADYKEAKKNNKVTLKAHFEGYYDDYDVERNFAVGLEYRQPKLKLTALDKTIYTGIGMDSADLWIYDPDSEMYLTPDTASITLETNASAANRKAYSKANADFTVDGASIVSGSNGETGVNLKITSTTVKGGAVKLSIMYDDWFNDPVIVSQSIRVTDKAVPKLTIKPAKLNINTAKFVGKEQASSAILLNGATGFTISDITLEGANAKAQEFLKFVDYEVTEDKDGNKFLSVSLKANADDGTAFPAASDGRGGYKMNSGYANSYSFKVSYKLGSVDQTTNFNLSLVNKEKLTVSTKGSIDIIDRANSTVTLKPKMTNFTSSQVAAVTLTGDAAGLFTITEFDKSTGTAIVKAKDTATLKKGSYKVYPVYTFDLGVSGTATMTTERPITISTKQSSLKISGLKEALEVKLSSPKTAAEREITVAPSGAYITNMTQISYTGNFTLTYTRDGVQVTIKNRAGLKEGKTYKITAIVSVEGSDAKIKKQIITVPVKVIR